MLNFLVKAPIKIIATFFVSLGLLLGAFIYFPSAFDMVQDWANDLSDAVRDWPSDSRSRVLWRTFTDSNAIMAVIVTIASRSIVELAAQLLGFLFGGGSDDKWLPRDKSV